MKKHLKLMACAAMAAMCTGAFAKDESDGVWLPIGLSIIAPPVQLPSPSHTVFGGMVNEERLGEGRWVKKYRDCVFPAASFAMVLLFTLVPSLTSSTSFMIIPAGALAIGLSWLKYRREMKEDGKA